VGAVATTLLKQIVYPNVPGDPDRLMRKLEWLQRLHEIGCHIAHSDYHKHGAYILDNADAIGFSLSEMHRLSMLVLGHVASSEKSKPRWRMRPWRFN